MQQEQEKFKGMGATQRGIVGGASAMAAASGIYSLLPEGIKSNKLATALAVVGSVGATLLIGQISIKAGEAAEQQFEQNQQTIAEQGNIIAQAEHQGLIQTKTVVERGPAA